MANFGLFLGVSDSGADASVLYLLGSASIGLDNKGSIGTNADVDFTLIAIPGRKVDFSMTAFAKNLWKKGFNDLFGKDD